MSSRELVAQLEQDFSWVDEREAHGLIDVFTSPIVIQPKAKYRHGLTHKQGR